MRGVREARRRYKGPFSGAHVCALLSEEGYVVANDGDEGAFRLYRKDGCKTVPVNESWTGIYDDDPIFNCLRRDLDLTRGKLRTRLNQIRGN